jgi:hypothetical protein
MTLSMTNITKLNATLSKMALDIVSFMPSATNKPFMLSATNKPLMLNVVMPRVVAFANLLAQLLRR